MLPFAVELCLKALKAQGGNEFIRTHNLKLLWEDLKTGEQRAVRKRVEDPAWRNDEPPLISWTDKTHPTQAAGCSARRWRADYRPFPPSTVAAPDPPFLPLDIA